jgi:hypothetical protein
MGLVEVLQPMGLVLKLKSNGVGSSFTTNGVIFKN